VSNAADTGRPRDEALRVYWRGEETTGLLLYGLRSPSTVKVVIEFGAWGDGAVSDEPWLLHGPGWQVDVWTLRLDALPTRDRWVGNLMATLDQLIEAGYQVAWFATEGDFVDPPHLFDPRVMGEGVYAARSRRTGFLTRDVGGTELQPLDDAQLIELHEAAAAVWS
jgi:hypothetical protein